MRTWGHLSTIYMSKGFVQRAFLGDSSLKHDNSMIQAILRAQRNEITEHRIYAKLAESTSDPHNKDVLERIAADEKRHYELWRTLTDQEVKPDQLLFWRYLIIAWVFGLTFSIKHMERGEASTKHNCAALGVSPSTARTIASEEEEHEIALIAMIDEERLRYVGSVVLGLNDALMELTGSLAGFSFARQNSARVGVVGLIMGVSASLSMSASQYLSTRHEDAGKTPVRSAVYTGVAYLMTVILLVTPYLLHFGVYEALGIALALAMGVILVFSYYVSVARDQPFGKRFAEMAVLSFGVAALSFIVGLAVRTVFHINI
jgi:VIT1/CCC1 family predicted Fe2+/Mn2+ transporter